MRPLTYFFLILLLAAASPAAAQLATQTIRQVSLSGVATCVLTAGGEAWCAGRVTAAGRGVTSGLGRFPVADGPVLTGPTTPLTGLIGLTGGSAQHCGLTGSGEVWCWGASGPLGDGTSSNGGGYAVRVAARPAGAVVPVSDFTDVAAGNNHTCGIRGANREVWCWGIDAHNECRVSADCATATAARPVPGLGGIGTFSNAVAVSAGQNHSCAVLASGAAACWGGNSAGQLGDPNAVNSSATPLLVGRQGGGPLPPFRSISAGAVSTCAVGTDGSVWCWGSRQFGALGDGNGSGQSNGAQPVRAENGAAGSLTGAVAVTGGKTNGFYCALMSDGRVLCWGISNVPHWMGVSGTSTVPLPVQASSGVGSLSGIRQVSANGSGVCSLGTQIHCTGGDASLLGVGRSTGVISVPTPMVGFLDP